MSLVRADDIALMISARAAAMAVKFDYDWELYAHDNNNVALYIELYTDNIIKCIHVITNWELFPHYHYANIITCYYAIMLPIILPNKKLSNGTTCT